jgi:hypothetical protein
MSVTSGNGGNADATYPGSKGGDGGTVLKAGSAGGGGLILLKCKDGSVESTDPDSTGSVRANGGNVIDLPPVSGLTNIMTAGKGGSGGNDGAGGKGGTTEGGPGTGAGGGIGVEAKGRITLAYYQAKAGSFLGTFVAVAGRGGDDTAAADAAGTGGTGGNVVGNGSGGDGGDVILHSDGAIVISTVLATGSSVGAMSATAGKGGDVTAGKGNGGVGGNVGDNGSGGTGGRLEIYSKTADVHVTGQLNVSGGSVGGYSAVSGDGGSCSTGAKGVGGGGGKLGNNGAAGKGGKMNLVGDNVTLDDAILADGGSVAGYTGTAGKGGDGTGSDPDGSVGGSGADNFGNNGKAGGGGSIYLTADSSVTAQLISARGGDTSGQTVTGGKGGKGEVKGGDGGNVGGGTAGGPGGRITITSRDSGITLNGNLRATGSKGGNVSATAGNGGFGTTKGGDGGTVGAAGKGGDGGTISIWIMARRRAPLTVNNNSTIAADGGRGGDLFGKGGDGGDSTPSPGNGTGGDGGNVAPAGRGGLAGHISINAAEIKPPDVKTTAEAGAFGDAQQEPGAGGKGNTPGHPGRPLV